jgi:hypothetical protein
MATFRENISQGTNWLSENIFDPLGNALGLNNLRHQFGYDPENASFDINEHSNRAMEDLGLLGHTMQLQSRDRLGMSKEQLLRGQEQMNLAQDMMSGKGEWYDNQRDYLEGSIASQVANMKQNQNKLLAERGIGGGGLRQVMDMGSDKTGFEMGRKAELDIMNQGIQLGQNQYGLGLQQTGMGVNMAAQSDNLLNMSQGAFGTQGQLAGQINALEAETAMFNADQANREKEFRQTSEYNQAAGNRDNKAGFWNNVIKSAATVMS